MRIWTLHPRVLDRKGLVAVWRESLLAQAVIGGRTNGYRHHPQLDRFRASGDPLLTIRLYLMVVLEEATRRSYSFDASRIDDFKSLSAIAEKNKIGRIPATVGQLGYEWRLLRAKVEQRDPGALTRLLRVSRPLPHPLFRIVAGGVEAWERPRELR